MDYLAIVNSADAWAHAHPYVLVALAAASAHRKAIFKFTILGAIKRWPWLLGKGPEVLADVDEFREDLKECLDEAAVSKAASEAAKDAAKTPTPPAP